ncbi:MAG: hypothetical protein HC831_32280 [Chloroflexia bacterium]|nr:hypothetical protein [Chloroflexia bacterium]
MYKPQKTFVLLAVVILVGLSACKQESLKPEKSLKKDSNLFEVVLVKLRNMQGNSTQGRTNSTTANPYEWIGIEHNNTLDYVFNNINFSNNQPVNIDLRAPYQNSPTTIVNAVGVDNQIYTYTQKYWNNIAVPQNLTAAQYATFRPVLLLPHLISSKNNISP